MILIKRAQLIQYLMTRCAFYFSKNFLEKLISMILGFKKLTIYLNYTK